jgi:hypothetical protein
MNTSGVRVLEIGDHKYIKEAFPDRTRLLWTGRKPPKFSLDKLEHVPFKRSEYFDCTPLNLWRAVRDVRAGAYDLIVTYLPLYSPWHPRNCVRSLLADPLHPWRGFARAFGVSWLQFVECGVPLVAIDLNDHFGIRRPAFFLLDKADVVFKRELPVDRRRAFVHAGRNAVPQPWHEKLRPISLVTPKVETARLWDGTFPEKTTDIFFSGNSAVNSWVRRTGIEGIKKLAALGVTVDCPDAILPPEEFYRRMSRAWLAWSPEGFSWECYRTGEAVQCLSVPVVNHPTVERHQPLLQGEHLIQYDVESDGLLRAVQAALSDKERLKKMALAAREHFLRHLTLQPMAQHIVEAGLSSKIAVHSVISERSRLATSRNSAPAEAGAEP